MTCSTSSTSVTVAPPLGWGWGLVALLLITGFNLAEPARGQSPPPDTLLDRYRTARVHLLTRQLLTSPRGLRGLPPDSVPSPLPPLLATAPSPDTTTADEPSFPVDEIRRVRDLERSWFQQRYSDVQWSFLGTSPGTSHVDTVRTRDLRARLQAEFGAPTRTLTEIYSQEWVRAPDSTREPPIQFAYWFVVNDSLPVRVTDMDGPGGRGLIVSTRRSHRDHLPALKNALLGPLRDPKRAPYVDYVYEDDPGRWYRVGFDGQSFFRERIARADIVPGRRPSVDTVRTAPSDSPTSESTRSSP